jgi:hypothetical protein
MGIFINSWLCFTYYNTFAIRLVETDDMNKYKNVAQMSMQDITYNLRNQGNHIELTSKFDIHSLTFASIIAQINHNLICCSTRNIMQ